jgi:hypothetical protein
MCVECVCRLPATLSAVWYTELHRAITLQEETRPGHFVSELTVKSKTLFFEVPEHMNGKELKIETAHRMTSHDLVFPSHNPCDIA